MNSGRLQVPGRPAAGKSQAGESVGVGDQVRILRGRWCNHTALVERETETSVKVSFAGGIRWYARTEVGAGPVTDHSKQPAEGRELPC